MHALEAIALRLYEAHLGRARHRDEGGRARGARRRRRARRGRTSSRPRSCAPSGSRSSTPGSSTPGRRTATSPRLGRKTRLPEAQRKVLWSIFERARTSLAVEGARHDGRPVHPARRASFAAPRTRRSTSSSWTRRRTSASPQLRFLAALGAHRQDALFFAGDLGQRIFQQPFSWKALGVDVRGRSRTLRVNYRTSHQIRQQADRLLASAGCRRGRRRGGARARSRCSTGRRRRSGR